MEKVNPQVGGQVRLIRELRGFSQESIALYLGISQQAYQKLESGRARICEKRLQQIATFLEVDQQRLIKLKKEEILDLFRKEEQLNLKYRLKSEILSIKKELKVLKKLNQRLLEQLE